MQEQNDLINQLAGLCGILPEYCDIFGKRHVASQETKLTIIKSMGLKTESAAELASEIKRLHMRRWKTFAPPVIVTRESEHPVVVTMHVPVRHGDDEQISVNCTIRDDSGGTDCFTFHHDSIEICERAVIDEVPHLQIKIRFNVTKGIGYYELDLFYSSSGFGLTGSTLIVLAPDRCYMPEPMAPESEQNRKVWGLALNLYSLTSVRNWGIGDLTDLRELGEWAAKLGASFLGINPLHALPNRAPEGISPYSPVSRLYKNLVYLDVEAVPDALMSSEAEALLQFSEFKKNIAGMRTSATIDYDGIAAAKLEILQRCFDHFFENHWLKDTNRAMRFKSFMSSEGSVLDDYGLFMALSRRIKEHYGAESWLDWPEEYRNIHNWRVEEFRKANWKEILFHQYVQWQIDEQQARVSESLRMHGMTVGLYQDLAIGSSAGGFDTWASSRLTAPGMDVGAPPDDFTPAGQNWGFPPCRPDMMTATAYHFFIQTIRKNMKYAGALRIDHALSIFRLFWIPEGMHAGDGAYVQYPAEDLLKIIALESVRNRTIVIGEDLGTVGDDVRQTLARYGMLSYKLLYFERNYPAPDFRRPAQYHPLSLCAVTTHDLPTLYGYWAGRDIETKDRLSLYPSRDMLLNDIAHRQRDKRLLLEALKHEGILPDTFSADPDNTREMISPLCMTIYEYLSRTESRMLSVSLDDIIGVIDQQNLPGTVREYPNWLQKSPVSIEKIMAGRAFSTLARLLKKNSR